MHVCILGVFCIIDCCFKCVYRIRCRFLYIWTYFKDVFDIFRKNVQKCERFSYELFFEIWGDLWVPQWSPPPSPSPAPMSKFPSAGNKYRKTCVFNAFYDFHKTKMKNGTKIKKATELEVLKLIIIHASLIHHKWMNKKCNRRSSCDRTVGLVVRRDCGFGCETRRDDKWRTLARLEWPPHHTKSIHIYTCLHLLDLFTFF